MGRRRTTGALDLSGTEWGRRAIGVVAIDETIAVVVFAIVADFADERLVIVACWQIGTSRVGAVDEAIARIIYFIVADFDGGFFRLRCARRIGGTSRIGTIDEAIARIIYFIVADFDGGFFRLRRARRIGGCLLYTSPSPRD